MGKTLAVNVIVADDKGEPHTYLAGDDNVPEWAAAKLGDHCWGDPSDDSPAAAVAAALAGPGTDHSSDEFADASDIPPMGGAGSGQDAWAAYAEKLGVELTAEDDSRDKIVAKIDAAGYPTSRE